MFTCANGHEISQEEYYSVLFVCPRCGAYANNGTKPVQAAELPDLSARVGEETKFSALVRAVYNGEDWNAIVYFDDENMNFAKAIDTLPGSNKPAIFKHPWGISHVGASGQVAMGRGIELWEQLCRVMKYSEWRSVTDHLMKYWKLRFFVWDKPEYEFGEIAQVYQTVVKAQSYEHAVESLREALLSASGYPQVIVYEEISTYSGQTLQIEPWKSNVSAIPY